MTPSRPLAWFAIVAVLSLSSGCATSPETHSTPSPTREGASSMRELEADLPTAKLSGSFDAVEGERGSWCWKKMDKDGKPAAGACADTMFIDPDSAASAQEEERLTLSFDRGDAPEKLFVNIQGSTDPAPDDRVAVPVDAANPSVFDVQLDPGTHWFSVQSWWPEGDVSFYFKLRV